MRVAPHGTQELLAREHAAGVAQEVDEQVELLRGKVDLDAVAMHTTGQQVKRDAEAAGLADIFKTAGADWRESGCSMCLGMNGDTVAAGQYSLSTSNRNFEGRQGAGARTLLASPLTAAASAVRGRITDPREML